MASKRDYVAIASILKSYRKDNMKARNRLLNNITHDLIGHFEFYNKNFDRTEFLEASGASDTR